MNRPEWIVLHHSFTSDNVLLSNFEAIKKYHIEVMKFRTIAYHSVIERVNGVLTSRPGRAETEEGAHCKEAGMNRRSIGICVVGNFDLMPPDLETLRFLRDMCFAYMVNYGIPAHNVIGHRDAGLMAGFDWRKIGPTGIREFKTCPGILWPLDTLKDMLKGDAR